MAQQYVSEVGTFIVPGAYPDVKVQSDTSGIATTGTILIIGEADAGAPATGEALSDNVFGPDQLSSVVAKYRSGNIVDAFRALTAPSRDANIQGAVNRVYIYKTNVSVWASGSVANQGFAAYGSLHDPKYGKAGNAIAWTAVASQAEVPPQTGLMTYIPTPDGASLAVRVSGGAKQTAAVAALQLPAAHAAALEALAGVLAQGGVNRGVLAGLLGINIDVAAAGSVATFKLATGSVFYGVPAVGDTLLVPLNTQYGAAADSAVKGAASANVGAYVVTSVSNTVSLAAITATKVRNSATGALTPPVTVAATAILALTDIVVCSPVNLIDISGQDRNFLTGLVGVNVTLTATGSSLKCALAAGSLFSATPQLGDILTIAVASPFKGAGSLNVGHFEVTAVSNTAASAYVTASKLTNGSAESVGATPIGAVTDIQVSRPAVDGLAKCLELYDNGGTDSMGVVWYQLGTATPVTLLSAALAPQLLDSAAEYAVRFGISRQSDNSQESAEVGGNVALRVGYAGTTASMTITATAITTAVAGGTGANLSVPVAQFTTLSDLAAYIDSQTGYSASLGSVLLGQRSPVYLDTGTFGICSELGSEPGRVKTDAEDFQAALAGSQLVGFVASQTAGLPDARSGSTFLSGGALGATSGAAVTAALDAAKAIDCNFVVPLFSRDASLDIADGLTDSASTYTIDAVNAGLTSHVSEMSTVKRRRHRQGFPSKEASFMDQKLAANNVAFYRCAMPFENPTCMRADGALASFQPWMLGVVAAGMQAAAFRKSICRKFMNVSGLTHRAGDYDQNSQAQVEDALLNGLLPAERVTGGFRWVSDQTTYSFDSNFVYNSVQAIYAADIVALSLAESADRAFTGQSVADISAEIALAFVKARMNEFLRLKLIAPSSDAPLGFKNVVVRLVGPSLQISLEIKLATAIYFIPISITISQVTQEATL